MNSCRFSDTNERLHRIDGLPSEPRSSPRVRISANAMMRFTEFPIIARRLSCCLPEYRIILLSAALGIITLLMLSSSQHLKRLGSHNSERVGICGTVSYMGKPLKSGTIYFKAQVVEAEYNLLDAKASVYEGTYAIPRHDGPEPGCFVVSISPTPKPHKSWRSGGTYVTRRPDDDSVIYAAMQDQMIVRIMPGRNNEFHFRLD